MPPPPPVTFATLTHPLPAKPYILSITRAASSPHLLLRHPSSDITIADNQSLQAVDVLRGGHEGDVTCVVADEGSLWTSGRDARVVRWDERARRPGIVIKAFVRKTLPVLSLASSESDHLVIGGTELASSEAHILFWDTRNPKEPAYTHSSTHSDDITHLSLLPATRTFLGASSLKPLPPRLLLSASTDGLVALSDLRETDEDEAVQAEENWGQSVAAAGSYEKKGKARIWVRSDMDGVATWEVGMGQEEGEEEEELQLQNPVEYPMDTFRFRTFETPSAGPSVPRTADEERRDKTGRVQSDYLVDVVPSLGNSRKGQPMAMVGSNDGDAVLLHSSSSSYDPSAYFLSGPGPSRGHKDVVRCLYHDQADEALYTGSEDGVLSGWSLASLPRMITGDPEVDDDLGDGHEEEDEDEDDGQEEESEIETEDEDEDEDMTDGGDGGMEVEPGPRNGPLLGRAGEERKEKRKGSRAHPY